MFSSKSTNQQLLCLSSVFGIIFIYGLSGGWSAPVIEQLLQPDSPIPVNTTILTWLSVIGILGEMIFVIVFGTFVGNMGRRKMLLWSVIIQTVSWILLVLDVNSLTLLLASMLVRSFGIAIFDIIGYTYLGEVCSPRNRAILSAVSLCIYAVGTEVEFVLGVFDSYTLLAVVPIVCCLGVLLASYYTCLESPYYLIMEAQPEEAMKVLTMLYAGDGVQQVAVHFAELQRYAAEEADNGIGFFHFLLLPANLKVCSFLFSVNSALYITGNWAFFSYGPVLMQPYSRQLNAHLVINVVGVVTLICSGLSSLVVDLAGRRFLLLFGFVLMAALQLALAALYFANDAGVGMAVFPQCMVGMIVAIIVAYTMTVYPAVHVLRAEFFPHALKIRGNCLMNVFKMVAALAMHGLFFPIADVGGIGWNFLMYAVIAALAALYVYAYYKETKGLTLTEVRCQYR